MGQEGPMTRFETDIDWLDAAIPEGLPVPSAAVISGPGEAGKPLLALGVVSSWLRAGGSVIAAPLQFPDPAFIAESAADLYGCTLDDYDEQIAFIAFDPDVDGIESTPDGLRANFVDPEIWSTALEAAHKRVDGNGPGTLLFMTALNLPLVSPGHWEEVLERATDVLHSTRTSALICVSTSMIPERIAEVEARASTLLRAQTFEQEPQLRFAAERYNGTPVDADPTEAPFDPATLETIQARADRHKTVPLAEIRAQ